MLGRRKHNHIVCIPIVILDLTFLLQPMVEIRKIQIGKELGKIIANGYARSGVYNSVEQMKQTFVLYLFPNNRLQDFVTTEG